MLSLRAVKFHLEKCLQQVQYPQPTCHCDSCAAQPNAEGTKSRGISSGSASTLEFEDPASNEAAIA